MEKEQHLTYFKVENFKRFDSLELNDIGQFNLIVGDNNVGKTSLLEALLFDESLPQFAEIFHKTLIDRNILIEPKYEYDTKGNIVGKTEPAEIFWEQLLTNPSNPLKFDYFQIGEKNKKRHFTIEFSLINKIESNANSISEKFILTPKWADSRRTGFGFSFKTCDFTQKMISGRFQTEVINQIGGDFYAHYTISTPKLEIPFISLSQSLDKDITTLYSTSIKASKNAKNDFIALIKVIISNIDGTEIRKLNGKDYLMVGVENQDTLRPISAFGEGLIRATKIFLEISKWRGQRLMIDEIDTGIHHSRLKEFLKTVFKVAQMNDVQLFMTTHSLECQQAFVEVFEDADMVDFQKDARQFSLIETPEKQIVASGRTFSQLQTSLKTGFDSRGGKSV